MVGVALNNHSMDVEVVEDIHFNGCFTVLVLPRKG